jgi:DNA-binding YbaB/EbfC family protein
MFGNMDMSKMTEMLGDLQTKAKQMQEEAKTIEFTAKGGGGLVSATVNGAGEVIDITFDDSLLEDKSSLQLLLIGIVNDALRMAEENKKSQAIGMFGGLNPFGSQ